jgi:hypothetical protein
MPNDRDDDQVFSITSARSGHSDDLGSREKRYAISMGIRTLCFVGAIIAWQTIGGWVPWLLLVGALVLPYTSVILANAGVRSQGSGADLITPEPYGTLEPGPSGDDDR